MWHYLVASITGPMRVVLWILPLLAALGARSVPAQPIDAASRGGNAPRGETPEEIIVRGKRLAEFRVEVQLARERAYAIFNEINSTDDFDISCESPMRTGTRVDRDVCAARFEGQMSARAAQDYLAALRLVCPGANSQDCFFNPEPRFAAGIAAARNVESEASIQRDKLEAEIHRLARTDLRFGQAILDFYDASLRYEEERKRPRERRTER